MNYLMGHYLNGEGEGETAMEQTVSHGFERHYIKTCVKK